MSLLWQPGDMDAEKVRIATLGAVRFGKPLVVDNGDLLLVSDLRDAREIVCAMMPVPAR